jgi:hypothetical protein
MKKLLYVLLILSLVLAFSTANKEKMMHRQLQLPATVAKKAWSRKVQPPITVIPIT